MDCKWIQNNNCETVVNTINLYQTAHGIYNTLCIHPTIIHQPITDPIYPTQCVQGIRHLKSLQLHKSAWNCWQSVSSKIPEQARWLHCNLIWQHGPAMIFYFSSSLYVNKKCPHVKKHCLAATHHQMTNNSLNLSWNVNILYNMSTKVSLKRQPLGLDDSSDPALFRPGPPQGP